MTDETEDKQPAPPGETRKGGEIVSLNIVARPDPLRITFGLRDYWEGLRRGRVVPDRADVQPRGIAAALDYAFILERIAPGAARFRLAGRHLVDLMGMEVRGLPFCALFNPDSRGRLSDVLETVFQAPQIAEIKLRSPQTYARPELNGRMLILPLKSDLGDITRALGCVVNPGEMGRAPRRFEIAYDMVIPIIKGKSALPPTPNGISETAPNFRRASPPKPRRSEPPPSNTATPEERRASFRIIRPDLPG
ncbi:PAS domain-containing protein [Paracoccus sp. SCSIO 75233]|uniref:PAS domain-containing protein n=1 Tax=Paracoccus sp. SCSIO 75233 TaxID=3017782 RepID=UPI0022F0DD78|nr:PAS domain-containing protein [Paracoccus sp. SCSIO 75233]WBU54398.1 PAS domain-containing protein [Paracoccus sp. SCSIO 75233]